MTEDFVFCPSDCRRLSWIPSPVHWCCTAAYYLGEHAASLHLSDFGEDLGAMQEPDKTADTPLAFPRPLPFLLWHILTLSQWGGDIESAASHPFGLGALQFACRLGLQEPRTWSWEFKKLYLFINALNKYWKSNRSWAEPHAKVLLFAESTEGCLQRDWEASPPSSLLSWLVTESH